MKIIIHAVNSYHSFRESLSTHVWRVRGLLLPQGGRPGSAVALTSTSSSWPPASTTKSNEADRAGCRLVHVPKGREKDIAIVVGRSNCRILLRPPPVRAGDGLCGVSVNAG